MGKFIPISTGEFIWVLCDSIGYDGGPFISIQIVAKTNDDTASRMITADEIDTYGPQILAAIKEKLSDDFGSFQRRGHTGPFAI